MINASAIKNVQTKLREALYYINSIKLSDVSSLDEMGELMELKEEFIPLHDKFNKFLIKTGE